MYKHFEWLSSKFMLEVGIQLVSRFETRCTAFFGRQHPTGNWGIYSMYPAAAGPARLQVFWHPGSETEEKKNRNINPG
jgi:hypothetical protein